jgi:hypothetical protein
MLAAAGVALLTDAAFGCPAAWRGVVYAALLVASAGASAGLVLGAWLRRPSPLYVARLIERARPDLKNALITFLELAREPGEDPSACAAVGRRAARILGEMQATAVLPPYDRRPAALAAAGMAGVVAAGLWLAQGVFIAPWIEGAQASITGQVGPGGPGVPRGTAADAVASAGTGAATQTPGAPDGSGAAAGSARAPDGAAQAPSAGGAGANSGRGGAGEGGRAGPEQGGSGTGTGAGDGAGDGGSAQALASAVRGDQPTFDRLAQALGQEGIGGAEPSPGSAAPSPGGAEPSPGGAAERTGSGRPGSPDSSGRGTPDATGATDPSSASGGEAGEGGTSRPDGRGAGTEEGASPGAGGSGGSASTQAGRRDRPPIPPRPQGRDFPPEALDALRAAGRIIEKAEERLQDGEANDGFLGEIGMSRQEFRRFVVAWKRRLETAAAGAGVTAAPEASRAAAAPPEAEVLQPGRADAARAVRGGESGEADATELFAGDETAVSPRLRPAVSAYFEALGRLARQRAKSLSE